MTWNAIRLILFASSFLFGYTALAQRPRVQTGSELVAPRLIRQVQPDYPELARQRHIHGLVIVEVHVNRVGRVTDARVVTGHPLLREAALIAVRQWVYEPFKFAGEPVEAVTTVAISFPPAKQAEEHPRTLSGPDGVVSFNWTFEDLSETRSRITQRLALSTESAALVAQASMLEQTVPQGMSKLIAAIEKASSGKRTLGD